MAQLTKEQELNKWQLQNFISGEDESAIHVGRRNKSGAESRSVPVCLCHIRSRLGFYEMMGNLDTFKHTWCSEKICTQHIYSNWVVIWFVFGLVCFCFLITFYHIITDLILILPNTTTSVCKNPQKSCLLLCSGSKLYQCVTATLWSGIITARTDSLSQIPTLELWKIP